MRYKIVLFSAILNAILLHGADSADCGVAKNCAECFQANPTCSWCFSENYDDSHMGAGFRCAPNDTLLERGCPAAEIDFVGSKESSTPVTDDQSQLNPRVRTVSVRPQDKLELNFTFESKADYPVDLYFLVDLSYTMRDDLDTVSRLTAKIVEAMKNVTEDLMIGFGAFVDKPVYPFINPNEGNLENPCLVVSGESHVDCDPTFLYKHILDLTTNFTEFQAATNNIRPSGNLDKPEGGLDALLQVAHCTDRIGWRQAARKIVLLASDDSSHLAGDGRLAGLIKPPPTTCQLTLQPDHRNPSVKYWGWYTGNDTDYPSVGEVAHVLTQTGISVIFATKEELYPFYSTLASFLPAASVGILAEDSGNIVNLLRENYHQIANKADVSIEHDSQLLDVKLLTKCHGATNFSEVKLCEKHPVGGRIEYRLTVSPKACFEGQKQVSLKMLGLADKAVLNVESACSCPKCQALPPSLGGDRSKRCNDRGVLRCGACECESGFSGEFCECSAAPSSKEAQAALLGQCRKEGEAEDAPLCSGRGRCVCGTCKCNLSRFQGRYCDCDKLGCARADDNKVCGGPLRGECQCDGTCKCKPGYQGPACDCLKDTSTCRNPNGEYCSGRGKCVCGMCYCEQHYTGSLCNEEQGSESAFCTNPSLVSCVNCLHTTQLKNDGTFREAATPVGDNEYKISPSVVRQCSDKCNMTNVDFNSVPLTETQEARDNYNLCIGYTEDNCRIYFHYRLSHAVYKERQLLLKIVRKLECTNPMNILWIVLAVIASIVIGGLLILLIFKLVITIDDRKQYASIQKHLEDSRWEMTMNPTYKEPSSTVLNPIFANGFD